MFFNICWVCGSVWPGGATTARLSADEFAEELGGPLEACGSCILTSCSVALEPSSASIGWTALSTARPPSPSQVAFLTSCCCTDAMIERFAEHGSFLGLSLHRLRNVERGRRDN